jgi:hypothetical protein
MKKYFLSMMSVMMMALVCVGFSACGDDDKDDGGSGSGSSSSISGDGENYEFDYGYWYAGHPLDRFLVVQSRNNRFVRSVDLLLLIQLFPDACIRASRASTTDSDRHGRSRQIK